MTGSAVAQAMKDAKGDLMMRGLSENQAEKALVTSVTTLIRKSLEKDPYFAKHFALSEKTFQQIDTEAELLLYLKEHPHYKVAFQNLIAGHGEEVYTMFMKGPSYINTVIKRWRHEGNEENSDV